MDPGVGGAGDVTVTAEKLFDWFTRAATAVGVGGVSCANAEGTASRNARRYSIEWLNDGQRPVLEHDLAE